MKAAPLISLGLSVVLGAGAILAGRHFMTEDTGAAPAHAAPAIAMTSILVATAEIEPGDAIDPATLRSVQWPADAVPEGALQDVATLGEKAFARGLIVPGEPLLAAKIDTSGAANTLAAAITPGMRAVSIVVREDTGVAGFVLPGDRVDVNEFVSLDENHAGVLEGARLSADLIAKPVLRHVKVLAVNQTFDRNLQGAMPSSTVTLEVTPEDARLLGAASQRGALGLALIGRDEEAAAVAVSPPPVEKPKPQTRGLRSSGPQTVTVRVINGDQQTDIRAPVQPAASSLKESR